MSAPAAFKLAAYSMRMVTAASRARSPYTFTGTAYDFGAGTWEAQVDLVHAGRAGSASIVAFLAGLQGPAGSFVLPVPDYAGPSGPLTVNPTAWLATSARAAALSVLLETGERINVAEYLTIGGALHIVTAAANPVGDVQALTIWPRLHAAVEQGATIEALTPTVTWALSGPVQEWRRAQDGLRSQSLSLVEALS
jgi:hypothetical protein